MCKFFISTIVVVLAICSATAQEVGVGGKWREADIPKLGAEFKLPDSLAHMAPWCPNLNQMADTSVKPSVSMSSVVLVKKKNLPSSVTVINNNSLRLGTKFNVSNGQAWNFGPFPDAYLDARTLSMPMRRK